MQIVSGRKAQSDAYKRALESQKQFFSDFEDSGDGTFSLWNYKFDKSLKNYYLNVWITVDHALGFYLMGPSIDGREADHFILGFSTLTPGGGVTAGLLAKEHGTIYLYHDGRTFSADGRNKPYYLEPQTKIKERYNYKIADIDAKEFFPRIVEYHQNRLNEFLTTTPHKPSQKSGGGFDAGNMKGGERSAVIFSAVHSPIAHALRDRLLEDGFAVIDDCPLKPDLLVKKDKTTILFEIKPYARLHDLIVACGQLMVYNEAANADAKLIVTEKFDLEKNVYLKRFIERQSIGLVFYSQVNKRFDFNQVSGTKLRLKKK